MVAAQLFGLSEAPSPPGLCRWICLLCGHVGCAMKRIEARPRCGRVITQLPTLHAWLHRSTKKALPIIDGELRSVRGPLPRGGPAGRLDSKVYPRPHRRLASTTRSGPPRTPSCPPPPPLDAALVDGWNVSWGSPCREPSMPGC